MPAGWLGLPDGGDALSGLQILPDGGGALSGLRRASSACEMTEVAVKRRPDKRSAIRQKCAAQKKTAPLARFSVTDYYF